MISCHFCEIDCISWDNYKRHMQACHPRFYESKAVLNYDEKQSVIEKAEKKFKDHIIKAYND